MSGAYQPSIFDLTADRALLEPLSGLTRHPLTAGAWVDVLPGWLTGSDERASHYLPNLRHWV